MDKNSGVAKVAPLFVFVTGEEIRRRESRQVGRDMEGFFEHGLGALHRLRIRTGYPADTDRLQREYPLSYLTIDERLFVRSCRGLIP